MKGTNNKYRARECSEAMCDRGTVKLLQFLHHEGYGGKAVQETGVHKKKTWAYMHSIDSWTPDKSIIVQMSLSLKGSSALQCFEHGNTVEIYNGIMF